MPGPRIVEEGKGDPGGPAPSRMAVEQLQAALAAIDALKEQAGEYLQQAGELQRQAAVGQVAIEVRGAVNLARIAAARLGALAAIERAKSEASARCRTPP